MADVVDLEKIDDAFLDVSTQFGLFAPGPPKVKQGIEHIGLEVRVAPELDVVEHRHAAKQRDILKAAPQSHLGALRCRHARDVLALEAHVAGAGSVETRNGIEERSLAGTVGPDDGRDGTRCHAEAHIAERTHAAKAQRDAVDLQQGGGAGVGAWGGCLHQLAYSGLCLVKDSYYCVNLLLLSRVSNS